MKYLGPNLVFVARPLRGPPDSRCDRHKDRQTDRQTDRHTDRHTDRQTKRQIDRHKDIRDSGPSGMKYFETKFGILNTWAGLALREEIHHTRHVHWSKSVRTLSEFFAEIWKTYKMNVDW